MRLVFYKRPPLKHSVLIHLQLLTNSQQAQLRNFFYLPNIAPIQTPELNMKIAIITLLFTSLVAAAPSANPLPESSAAVRPPTSFIPHSILLLTQV
jgi:hypothetical protein